eukprot:3840142-Prymnesium_polylepis.1
MHVLPHTRCRATFIPWFTCRSTPQQTRLTRISNEGVRQISRPPPRNVAAVPATGLVQVAQKVAGHAVRTAIVQGVRTDADRVIVG